MKRFGWVAVAGGLLLAAGAGGPVRAQTATVAVEEENFRAQPQGSILAELLQGTPLALGEARGQWREATLDAWIWGRSVQSQSAGGHDLVVNAGGENLRAEPNGTRLGRARGGMRLETVEERGDWIRVRRTAWIWTASLQIRDDAARTDDPPIGADGAAPGAAPAGSVREFAAAAEGTIILDGPAGDTLARLRQGAGVEVVAREGDWSRVRIDGWTFTGALSGADSTPGGILRGISRDSLQSRPEAYRGRILEWSIQFIAVREAEGFRTDFLEGESFILARGPGEGAGFVYVAVPPDLLPQVSRLAPLRRIRILARVRSVRSPLTDAPVLELLDITAR